MLQNVLSFFTKYQPYFQMALGVWQILKFTPPAAVIQGVMGWLRWLAFPGLFPAYERLRKFPGCLFKTVKCVMLTEGKSQSKTKPQNKGKHASIFASGSKDRNGTMASKPPMPVHYLGETFEENKVMTYLGEKFEVKRKGNKVFVNEKMSYYISDRKWELICQMEEKCFGTGKKDKVVFVKGCQYIWQKVLTGEVMEFGEVLDDVIFEDNINFLISDNVWFLPVDLSEDSVEKLPKLLNLVGLFFSTHKKTSLILAKSFSIASAILEIKAVRSRICWIINKMFCESMHYICNKLPFAVRGYVYWLFICVENLMPRNDIRLKVVRCDYLNVVIGGSAKSNSAQEATRVPWLDEKEEYEFRCGCSIVMKATYDSVTKECMKATMQHTGAVFPTVTERVFLKCQYPDEFMRIGTFLSCLATSKAGSLFKYDCNDNKVHVRGWRESLRHYVDAEFPEIYTLRLHDVIV